MQVKVVQGRWSWHNRKNKCLNRYQDSLLQLFQCIKQLCLMTYIHNNFFCWVRIWFYTQILFLWWKYVSKLLLKNGHLKHIKQHRFKYCSWSQKTFRNWKGRKNGRFNKGSYSNSYNSIYNKIFMKYLWLNTCHKNRIDKLNNRSAELEGSPTFQGGDFFS